MNNKKEELIEKIDLLTEKINSLNKVHSKKIAPTLEKQQKIKSRFFYFIVPFISSVCIYSVGYTSNLWLLFYSLPIGFTLIHKFFEIFPCLFSKNLRRKYLFDKKIKKEINRLEVEKKSLLLKLKNNDILFFSEKGIDEKSIDVILEKEFREQHADLFLIIEKVSDELDFSGRRILKKTLDNELNNHLKNNKKEKFLKLKDRIEDKAVNFQIENE